MKILILGASGKLGRVITAQALTRGHLVSAQGRTAPSADSSPAVSVLTFDPAAPGSAYPGALVGHDAVIYALGFSGRAPVEFFSATTRALLDGMQQAGVKRLVAVTGVGAGDSRGHGGWLYDRIVFPFFTKPMYADKDRQEALISASDLDWTILRPAPFNATAGAEPLHALTTIAPRTRLNRVTLTEVADFALDCVERGSYLRQAVFFGHGVAG